MGTWLCRSLNSSPNRAGQAFSRSDGSTTRGPWSRLSVAVKVQASSSVQSSLVADAFALFRARRAPPAGRRRSRAAAGRGGSASTA